tara:strand:+ start:178174 stop:178677 length:504 start_codon:yes stop_codon:yes gene_type:complete
MKTHFSVVVWMLVVSIFMKMAVFAGNWQFSGYERIYFFGNLFVIMIGVFLGIRLFKALSHEKTGFMADVKAGIKVAGMYAVLMSLFVYLYYSVIDQSYFPLKIEEQMRLLEESGRATGDDLVKSRETAEFILAPYFQSTFTLILYLLLGTFYSALITFFVRKVRNEF